MKNCIKLKSNISTDILKNVPYKINAFLKTGNENCFLFTSYPFIPLVANNYHHQKYE